MGFKHFLLLLAEVLIDLDCLNHVRGLVLTGFHLEFNCLFFHYMLARDAIVLADFCTKCWELKNFFCMR